MDLKKWEEEDLPNSELISHNESQCSRAIVKLGPGIWTAVGYAASNVHMIEGDSNVTVVDTTESTKAAQNICSEFQKLSNKHVRRIIYTHSHRDHISGESVFTNGQEIPILASASFKSDLIGVEPDEIAQYTALARRTQAQFGIGLSEKERISLGSGPGNRPMVGLGQGFLPPTEFIDEDCDVSLDGIEARLLLAPGETADHMMVWLPKAKILVAGDNWYHAFPNLYAIRGTPYRDYSKWAHSLSLMEDLNGLG